MKLLYILAVNLIVLFTSVESVDTNSEYSSRVEIIANTTSVFKNDQTSNFIELPKDINPENILIRYTVGNRAIGEHDN